MNMDKTKKNREHDYIYDPNFILCHQKDFNRQAQKSAMASSQLVLYPVFDSMFSDLKQFRRIDKVRYPNARLPDHVEISYEDNRCASRPTQIQGKIVPLFFARPKVDNIIVIRLEKHSKEQVVSNPSSNCEEDNNVICGLHNTSIQTMFRESSTQTDPIQPECYISKKHKSNAIPEIYLLENIYSSHEGDIMSVERQRVRRAWIQTNTNPEIVAQLEDYDWKFREMEIEKMLILQEEILEKEAVPVTDREILDRLWRQGSERLSKELKKIRSRKEKAYAQIEAKSAKLKSNKYGKCKEKYGTTVNKKPYKLAINLNHLPFESEYNLPSLNLEPTVTNKYGLCDKFERKKERFLIEIKSFLQNLREPLSDNKSEDTFSFFEKSEESIVESEEVEEEEEIKVFVETADKNTAIDFNDFMAERRECNINISHNSNV